MDSSIKIWIEKSLNGTSWEKASGSFNNPVIKIYNGYNSLKNIFPMETYFNTYSTSDTFTAEYYNDSMSGSIDSIYMTWDVNVQLDELVKSSYYYKLAISSSNNDIVFNPAGFNVPLQWELNIDNPSLSSNFEFTISNPGGKFWDFYTSGSTTYYNKLVLESNGGNFYYNKGYYQAQLPYHPSYNSRFKGGSEPIDTQFPNINDEWKLEIGDQIRFENDELKVFNITNIGWDEYASPFKLLITVDRDIPPAINLNFFLIRRWKENKNNITMNRTFPYSQPLVSSSLAPTTTGFIFPKYPIDEIAKNPDKIIRDLIDKKIIE